MDLAWRRRVLADLRVPIPPRFLERRLGGHAGLRVGGNRTKRHAARFTATEDLPGKIQNRGSRLHVATERRILATNEEII